MRSFSLARCGKSTPLQVVDVLHAIVAFLTPDHRGRFLGPVVGKHTRAMRACLLQRVAESIGEVELNELTAGDIRNLQQSLILQGRKPGYCNQVTHGTFLPMLKTLEDIGPIDPAVILRCRKAKRLRVPREVIPKHYTPEQRDAAIVAFRDSHWLPLVTFLFFTGCRVGEALGLRWCDVDMDARRLVVAISRDRNDTTPCKTGNSQRCLEMHAAIHTALSALPRGLPSDYVFQGRAGRPASYTYFRSEWHRILKEAGLPRLKVHGTRHTVATELLTNGVHPAQVAAFLGATVDVILKTYAHVIPQFDVNAALGRTPTPPPVTQVVAERPRLRLVKG